MLRTRLALASALALIAASVGASPAAATDGILDTGFSSDGKLRVGIPLINVPDGSVDTAPAGGGRFAVLSDNTQPQLVRFVSDGTQDPSFGTGGVARPLDSGAARALAIQPDGKAVVLYQKVVGGPPTDFRLARFTTAGALDTTFGDGGIAVAKLNESNSSIEQTLYDVAVAPGGRIVVAGVLGDFASEGSFSAAAFDPEGNLDTTFSTDGRAFFNIGTGTRSRAEARAIAIQPDGKVILAGFADVNGDLFNPNGCGFNLSCQVPERENSFAIMRLGTDGELDTTFAGGTGLSFPNIVTGSPECVSINTAEGSGECVQEIESAEDVVVQPDGKILAAGFTDSNPAASTNQAFALARLNANGSADSTFDGDGRLFTNVAPSPTFRDGGSSVAVLADGRILAGGFAEFPATEDDFALLRYSSAGVLDATFDGDSGSANGAITTTLVDGGNDEHVEALGLLPSGNVVAVGTSEDNPANQVGVGIAVYRNDGTAPNTTITSGPTGGSTITVTRATFAFTSSEAGSFLCTFGGTFASATACATPFQTPELANGSRTFSVFAKDSAGNVDPTPATRTFNVNVPAPVATLTADPGAFTADETPTFGFTSTTSGATFECAYDGAAFGSCSASSSDTRQLAPGTHSFSVRAASISGTGAATTPFGFEIDTTTPEGAIAGAPASLSNDNTPGPLTLSSDEPAHDGATTFACELAGPAPSSKSCGAGSFDLAGPLPDGTYTFRLGLTDSLGRRDSSPASATFTIDTLAPETTATGPKKVRKGKRARFTLSASEPGSSLSCVFDGRAAVPCAGAFRTAKLRKGRHVLTVTATDAAGNADATPAKRTVRVKRPRRR